MVTKAREAIKQLWSLYKETNDEHLIAVIQQTQAVAAGPNQQTIQDYTTLREQMDGKGSWGRIVAGIMLSVVGLALIVGAALGIVFTAGLATPLTVPVIAAGAGALALGVASATAGIGFFDAGCDKPLYKEMQLLGEEASMQLNGM